MLEKDSENILIEKAKKGDMTAFRKLTERFEKPVSAVVISFLGKTEESENIAQDVFIKFYFNIHKFKGKSSLKTYLVRIAINLSLNELKKQKRMKSREIDIDESMKEFESEIPVQDEFDKKEAIELALSKLPPEQRSVVVLRLIEGYSTKETAELLKIPEGTVLSRLFRGQQAMKELLKHYLET